MTFVYDMKFLKIRGRGGGHDGRGGGGELSDTLACGGRKGGQQADRANLLNINLQHASVSPATSET